MLVLLACHWSLSCHDVIWVCGDVIFATRDVVSICHLHTGVAAVLWWWKGVHCWWFAWRGQDCRGCRGSWLGCPEIADRDGLVVRNCMGTHAHSNIINPLKAAVRIYPYLPLCRVWWLWSPLNKLWSNYGHENLATWHSNVEDYSSTNKFGNVFKRFPKLRLELEVRNGFLNKPCLQRVNNGEVKNMANMVPICWAGKWDQPLAIIRFLSSSCRLHLSIFSVLSQERLF